MLDASKIILSALRVFLFASLENCLPHKNRAVMEGMEVTITVLDEENLVMEVRETQPHRRGPVDHPGAGRQRPPGVQ